VNENFINLTDADCSCLQVEVMVHESWIDRFMAHHELVIPVGEKYHLIDLKVDLEAGSLKMQADIQEKRGSSIIITCKPLWNAEHQQIQLTDLRIDTLSKNILLKSAGWFAKTFMGAKIDKQIEEATSRLYTLQMEKILRDGISIPIPNAGSANVLVRSVTIIEMIFLHQGIKVKAMIDGYWKLELQGE
jgi:hypothetical protein